MRSKALPSFLRRFAFFLVVALVPTSYGAAQTLPAGVISAPPTVIDDNESIGSNTTLNVSYGGSVGSFFEAGLPDGSSYDVIVNISGGTVDRVFRANSGSTVNISGGMVGDFLLATAGSIVSIDGGAVGNNFRVLSDGTVSISGGGVGDDFNADRGSTVNISGGTFGPGFHADNTSTVNLIGTEFYFDGEPVDLDPGLKTIFFQRRDILTGVLADGSSFDFDLATYGPSGRDYFAPDATLTLTLVTPPLAGDFNADGVVDAADYTAWRDNEGSPEDGAILAGNGNGGVVDSSDYELWAINYGSMLAEDSINAVPEPCSIATIGLALLSAGAACRRSA